VGERKEVGKKRKERGRKGGGGLINYHSLSLMIKQGEGEKGGKKLVRLAFRRERGEKKKRGRGPFLPASFG